MKKIIMLLLFVTPSLSHAWEVPKNPDRFPSLGLTYTGVSETGDYNIQGYKQDVETTNRSLIADLRLPLATSFTLSIGVGGTHSEVLGKENFNFYGSKTDTSGGLFTISGRFYFNQ